MRDFVKPMTAARTQLTDGITREWTRLGAELLLLAQSLAERLRINITDLQCLAVVSSSDGMTAGQLAETVGLTTGAITGVVDRLEKAGLVRREDDPGDRRRVVLRAISGEELAGRDAAVVAAIAALSSGAAEQYADYSDRELELVADALSRAHPLLLEQVAALRGQEPARHEMAAPLHGARAGRLILAPAYGKVTIDSDAALPTLYSAHVEGTPPVIEVDGGTVTVRQRHFPLFGWGHRDLRMTLNGAIPWDVEVPSGAWRLSADLTGVQVRSFTIRRGASRIELHLGRPVGAVRLLVDGGASNVLIRRPRGVPVEVTLAGGVSQARVDGHKLGPAGGEVMWHTPGAPTSPDRYVIEARRGVSKLTVESG